MGIRLMVASRHEIVRICGVAAVAMMALSPATAQQPEIVAPGVISLEGRNETFPAIDPVDGSLWFSVYTDGFDRQTIMRAQRRGSSWSPGEVVGFSGTWGDRAPRFSPDGRRLYFTSNRPAGAGQAATGFNIWVVERIGGGGWATPRLAPGVNADDGHTIHSSATTGAIYAASNRPGGSGRSDIYRVGHDGAVEHLPRAINDENSQPDLWVSPDERWMILVVTDRPGGEGGDDLHVSYRRPDGWTAPANLGPGINSPEYEYGPTVSPDGRHLYFTSHVRGSADLYRVELATLDPAPDVGPDDASAIRRLIEDHYVSAVFALRDEAAVRRGFHADFQLFVRSDDGLLVVPLDAWLARLELDGIPSAGAIRHEVAFIDVTGDAALARTELFVDGEHEYTDYFALYRMHDGWRIVAKTFQSHD